MLAGWWVLSRLLENETVCLMYAMLQMGLIPYVGVGGAELILLMDIWHGWIFLFRPIVLCLWSC